MCLQITGNTIKTLAGAIQVGGSGIYTSAALFNNITITNNVLYNVQQGPLTVWSANNVGPRPRGFKAPLAWPPEHAHHSRVSGLRAHCHGSGSGRHFGTETLEGLARSMVYVYNF